MIGGFARFGQSSTLSGTPSASASSCTVPQEPSLISPCFWQVCGPRPRQIWLPGFVHSLAPAVHRTVVATLQWPTAGQQVCPTGHAALVSAVQKLSLIRLHDPTARGEGRAFRQSPSQASPMPSPSWSVCPVFGVRTQLSSRSWTLSPSMSVLLLHAAPRVVEPVPGTCAGL